MKCSACGAELESDFGIVVCAGCGHQNIVALDTQETSSDEVFSSSDSSVGEDLGVAAEWLVTEGSEPVVTEFSPSDIAESEVLPLVEGSDLEASDEEAVETGSLINDEGDFKVGEEVPDSLQPETEALELDASSDKPMVDSPAVDSPDQVLSEEPSSSFQQQISDFANSDQLLPTTFLFGIRIFDINLAEDRELILGALQSLRVEESAINWQPGGAVEVKPLSAAKTARLIKLIGGAHAQYQVFEVSL